MRTIQGRQKRVKMGDGLDEESDWFFSVYIFLKRKFKEVTIQKLICAMKKK